MNLLQLRYFCRLAKEESFTKAAQSLYISQPALSQMVARLEEELGVRLFQREGKKIRLNRNGELFLEYVDRSLEELDQGLDALKRIRSRDGREISFASMGNLSTLFDVMLQFKERYPDVKLKYNSCRAEDSIRKLLDYEIEFAINNRPAEDPRLENEVVHRCAVLVCLGNGHPLAGRGVVSLRELADSKFVCNDFSTDEYETWRICGEAGFRPNIALECNDSRLIREILNRAPYAMLVKAQALELYARAGETRRDSMVRLREDVVTPLVVTRRRKHHFSPSEEELFRYILTAFRESLLRDEAAYRVWAGRQAEHRA